MNNQGVQKVKVYPRRKRLQDMPRAEVNQRQQHEVEVDLEVLQRLFGMKQSSAARSLVCNRLQSSLQKNLTGPVYTGYLVDMLQRSMQKTGAQEMALRKAEPSIGGKQSDPRDGEQRS
ncbi:hypothetical protein GUITHDRAFT_120300 [Guillardia theta CCMP2712]|uniref:Uncharacterized protein n=1 Tax=Guillardia theta (strain CCMP2712) TaxID=905079 RepID=L1IB93_GUITC|nr:hypothetical protein GUITHDRAFT_120300 [Guillardia theta CCMP2712]EKX33498.1 hypothetical protein GUITHDRAFT_120300 [Guillardia theta CCMP2712]|eukprot:XP_005820478.1 hypothetical protein GUITHDRAFT_120300 [Guillardia theta CCMP2712]